ncbi:MAG: hypothetical protein HUJ53_04120, partial [Holdemanella sp.]|nr:hypothetical protein [Holdemanella sp.]
MEGSPHIICNLRYAVTQYHKGKIPVGALVDSTDDMFEYNDRDEACDKTMPDNTIVDNTDDMFNYNHYRLGSTGTWNQRGYISVEQSKRLADRYRPEIVWQLVLSFDDEFADEYDIKPKEKMKKLVTRSMNRTIKSLGFDPDNVEWQASYHTNTEHPHCHICFYEKKRSRSLYKLPKDKVEQFRS